MGVLASKIDYRGSPDRQLLTAASEGNLKAVRRSLNRGANIDIKGAQDNRTPLHRAASKGHLQVVSYLCEQAANLESTTEDAVTPLHVAVMTGQLQVVEFLLEHGANVNAATKEGATPLHTASRLGRVEIVRALCEHGADCNAADKSGNTALHYAAEAGEDEIAKELLEHGADVHRKNTVGNTPLHVAAPEVDIVILLLQSGAMLGMRNADGRSALDELTLQFGSELGFLLECIRDDCPEALSQLCNP